MRIELPEVCLVVLVGASSSGKSSFAARHFGATEVVSSDACRALVADDEAATDADTDTFDLVHHLTAIRLRRGLLTVVDATSVHGKHRIELARLAKKAHVRSFAVVLDPPLQTLQDRHAAREDRSFDEAIVVRHHADLHRGLPKIKSEGFAAVHMLTSVEDIDSVEFARLPLANDQRDRKGPFDIIGDVHGCASELKTLLVDLGWQLADNRATHPEGRTAVFLGDLVDRGPDSVGALELAMNMVDDGVALCVPGNHEAKFSRWIDGKNVAVSHGLSQTIEQFEAIDNPDFEERVRQFIRGLTDHLRLDGGRLVVAHAGLKEVLHGREGRRVSAFCMWGDTTGKTDDYGLPIRLDWAKDYTGEATVVYGHTPVLEAEWVNNTICIDTACVFGGMLTALRWPERELVQVRAERPWYTPTRPLQ